MKLQVLRDSNGNDSGVYIPSKDWLLIKQQYPDIENVSNEIPDWQKEILSSRLEEITNNPKKIKPIQGLFDTLNKKTQ